MPSRFSSTRSMIVLDSSIVPICLKDFTLLSIASTACFNFAAERPHDLKVEAKALRLNDDRSVPAAREAVVGNSQRFEISSALHGPRLAADA